jgi:uncharacterized membrane protein HdeD (DUF308 family)
MESEPTNLGPETIDAGKARTFWGGFVAIGVILILVGLVAIVYPLASSVTMTKLLGVLLIIGGISQGLHGIVSRQWKGFLINMAGALLLIVIGGIFLSNPEVALSTFTLILGIYLVIAGLIKTIGALMLRSESGWGWMLLGGLVDFVVGALIWANWPSTSDWVIGLLVGLSLFFSGWSLLMIGIAARTLPEEDTMQAKMA